jgi:hypothetical protein
MIAEENYMYENNELVFIEGLFYNQIANLTKRTRGG